MLPKAYLFPGSQGQKDLTAFTMLGRFNSNFDGLGVVLSNEFPGSGNFIRNFAILYFV
jgi:hypothetical protein